MKLKSTGTGTRISAPKKYGKLFDPDKLLEQEVEFISEGMDQSGNDYDFFLGKISRSPIIKSRKTGKCFILPWPDIIKLGAEAGLNKSAKRR